MVENKVVDLAAFREKRELSTLDKTVDQLHQQGRSILSQKHPSEAQVEYVIHELLPALQEASDFEQRETREEETNLAYLAAHHYQKLALLILDPQQVTKNQVDLVLNQTLPKINRLLTEYELHEPQLEQDLVDQAILTYSKIALENLQDKNPPEDYAEFVIYRLLPKLQQLAEDYNLHIKETEEEMGAALLSYYQKNSLEKIKENDFDTIAYLYFPRIRQITGLTNLEPEQTYEKIEQALLNHLQDPINLEKVRKKINPSYSPTDTIDYLLAYLRQGPDF